MFASKGERPEECFTLRPCMMGGVALYDVFVDDWVLHWTRKQVFVSSFLSLVSIGLALLMISFVMCSVCVTFVWIPHCFVFAKRSALRSVSSLLCLNPPGKVQWGKRHLSSSVEVLLGGKGALEDERKKVNCCLGGGS